MTWSYDSTLATSKDQVRFYVGDTNTSSQKLSDEEIAGMLTIWGDALPTAAAIADSLAAKYASSVDFSAGDLRISNSQRAQAYRELAQRLRAQLSSGPAGIGTPVVTGTSISEMEGVNDNSDREPNRFKVGMMDFPGSTLSGGSDDETGDDTDDDLTS